MLQRTNGLERPFILTRSYTTGSQKYAAIWSGDCRSDWGHFNMGIPILLQTTVCGVNFVGSDVPGFFGEPTEELVVRWY